ncbi:MAG: hypothetical protein JJW01_03270 [Alphaproteobacteria bacterium]|nr:hypothetical protein [Rickettsiales bacterium]
MSGKSIIEAIKSAMSNSIRTVERDMVESNQLQNTVNDKNWHFSTSAYRASYKRLKRGLKDVCSISNFVVPEYSQVLKNRRNIMLHYTKILPGCNVLLNNEAAQDSKDQKKVQNNDNQKDNTDANCNLNNKHTDDVNISENKTNNYRDDNYEQEEPQIDKIFIYKDLQDETAIIINPLSSIGLMARGMQFLSSSICIVSKNDSNTKIIESAVVYDFATSCFYTATHGRGAYLNFGYNIKAIPSSNSNIKLATVFGFISPTVYELGNDSEIAAGRKDIITKIAKLSIMSFNYISLPNIELGIVYVASGKCDLFCYSGNIDIGLFRCAAKIAEEAGAVMLNSSGSIIHTDDLALERLGFFVVSKSMVNFISDFLLKK